jgi:Sulfotransferase family
MNIGLIIGCARSGTSILGELIAAHPDVKYVFEAHPVWQLGGQGVNDAHRLTAEHAVPELRQYVRQWFEQKQGKANLVIEKNPRNVVRVPYLRAIFPEAKIIHIVRDGRDVACSLLPGNGDVKWLHVRPPSWQSIFSEHTGVMRCALGWKDIVRIALDDLAAVPHLQIYYEDLVTRSRETTAKVMDYLGLKLHPNVIEFSQKIQNETDGSYHAQHQVLWYRDNHSSRIGRWRENLDETQKLAVNAALHDILVELGYE